MSWRDCSDAEYCDAELFQLLYRDDGVVLYLKSGKQLKTDILLWANGRTGNSDNLGLEAAGIKLPSNLFQERVLLRD